MIESLADLLGPHVNRLLHFGISFRDLRSAGASTTSWFEWCSALSALADHYAERAGTARLAGRRRTAAECGLRAAAYYHFAHFKTSPAARDAAVAERRCVEVYRGIADFLQPAAMPVVLRCGGVTVPAYFRCAAAGAPIVILLNGLDSCKEVELHRFGDLFLARGLNVLAVDAPGQGEGDGAAPLLPAFDAAVAPLLDLVERWNPSAVGVFGVSFGGHLAARAAALDSRIAACVSLGGFHDADVLARLPDGAAAAFRRAFRLGAHEPLASVAHLLSLESLRDRLDRPFLIVHGGNDHLVTRSQVERLVAWGGEHVTARIVEGAEHVCTDRFADVLPEIGDWMCDRLSASPDRPCASSLIDLSLPLDASPSERIPVGILRFDHAAGATQMADVFGVPIQCLPDNLGWAGELVTLGTHCGTHMDAPWHYGPTCSGRPARTIDEIPIEWCCAPGVVLDFESKPDDEAIEPDDLERALDDIGYELTTGDIVLVRTGASGHWGAETYPEHGAGFGRAGIEWLTRRGVRIIGTDAWGLDRPFVAMAADYRRTADASVIWPAHFAGRNAEYCQIEKLTNLDRLPPFGFTVFCFPVRIARASAAWVRVVASLNRFEALPHA
jgi:kynurenine formamidase/alpha-beta hydrolase superfamily lysophospholipase